MFCKFGFQTSWHYGVDISTGVFPKSTPHVLVVFVFRAVDEIFAYTVGDKVAMAVFYRHAADKDSARMS